MNELDLAKKIDAAAKAGFDAGWNAAMDERGFPLEPTEAMRLDGGRRLLSFEDGTTDESFDALQWRSVKNLAERVWRSMWLAARDAANA